MYQHGNSPPVAPPEAQPQNWFEQMLMGMGFPPPQQIVNELQRLNSNLERYAPHLQTIAGALSDPTQIQGLTNALREASNTGKSLLNKLR